MNHKLIVAAVATAALAVGGSTIALADGDAPSGALAASLRTGGEADDRDDDRDDVRNGDGGGDDRQELRGAEVTLQEAVDAALRAVPGAAESAELDDDESDRPVWDVDVLGEDGRWHDVTVDAGSGDVLGQRSDRDDGGDDRAGGDDDREDAGGRSDDSGGSDDRDDRTESGDDRDDHRGDDRNDDRNDDGDDSRDDGDDRGDG